MSVTGSQRLLQMAKETGEGKGSTKKRKGKNSETKKVNSSKAPLITAECQLRKMIKDKKKKSYTVDEVNDIYASVKESKSGFSTYQASIYPDMIAFKPIEKAKKIKPVVYANIGQIVQVPGDLNSFLLHIPKSNKTKPFTALLTWLDPQMPERFETVVHKANSSLAKTLHEASDADARDGNFLPTSNASDAICNASSLPQLQTAAYFPTSLASSESDTNDSISDIIRVSKRVSETYTHYCPNRTLYRNNEEDENHNVQALSQSSCSSDSSYDEDSDDSAYVCRDKGSVFYGERMSPKSQYIDRLLRATVQMRNGSRCS